MNGLFVVVEGIDGCGKSTQLDMLAGSLRLLGRPTKQFHDPGSTALGRALRAILLNKEIDVDHLCQLLLFTAARRATAQEIMEALRTVDVLCDRWVLSTIVYQGRMGDISSELISELHQTFCNSLLPDVYVVLDVPVDIAKARMEARPRSLDDPAVNRFESQPNSWFESLRRAYRAQGSRSDMTLMPIIVDGCGPAEDVHTRVLAACLNGSHKFAKVYAQAHLFPPVAAS